MRTPNIRRWRAARTSCCRTRYTDTMADTGSSTTAGLEPTPMRSARSLSQRRLRGPRGGKATARACALAGALVLALWTASPALATDRSKAASDAAHWVGRYCTTRACADAKASPLSHAAGFGAAVLGALWLAGRPSAKS